MKRRLIRAVFLGCALLGLGLPGLLLFMGTEHHHCILQTAMALRVYAGEHDGHYPFNTNGFGNAILALVAADLTQVANICGPDDDGHLFQAALTNHFTIPEDQCSRIYIQGLSETNDPQICILFDRDSHKGGDHSRSVWGPPLREALLLDGSMQSVRDKNWPEFSRKQVDLLVAAGFARTNALRYYPAAKE